MIYEHGNRSTAVRAAQRRHVFKRALGRWKMRWGRRFRRRMLERARATNVWRMLEQMPPYCLLPFFTRRYLMRSRFNEGLQELRAKLYLVVLAREMRRDGHHYPVIHAR